MPIEGFSGCHVACGKSSDQTHLCLFAARALMEDRVDSGPRDHRFELGSDARRASTSPAKGKTCGT